MFLIKKPTFFLLFFINIFHGFAQKPEPIEFGKIPLEQLQMKIYSPDSSAEAVVLCDYGDYSYTFPDYRPIVNYHRHVRIKILKKSGFSRANIKVAYRFSNDNRNERIRNLQAVTYNLEDGIITTYTLDKKGIFDEKVNKDYHYQTFTLPQVREGSVIEYSYDMESDIWYNLRQWDFQKNIPVVWSELRASLPAYFDFNITLRSLIPLSINENEQDKQNFLRSDIADKFMRCRFVMKDVPALKEEPYLTTIENFRSKLTFELAATYFPNQPKKDYSQTWESLNETLLIDENVGRQIKRFDQAETIAQTLKAIHRDSVSLATAAYKFIQNTMQWNGNEAMFVENNIDKVYEKRIGNAAEINLMLIRLLRECGFDANPVILSTRENGEASDLVLLDRFNYLIAHIRLKNKDVLLDATDHLTTMGMLPMRCLNDRGRLIVRKNSRWITINPEPVNRKTSIVEMEILPEQVMKGSLRTSYGGYEAVDFRKKVILKGKETFETDYKKNRPNWKIGSIQLLHVDSLETLAEIEVQTAINESYAMAGERLYVSPMLWEAQERNPFSAVERQYPVNFGVPQEEYYIATFTFPNDYVIEELPKPENVSLPNNGGKFLFSCTTENNTLRVISKITLKKAVYTENDYGSLREFYNRIVAKHAEQVVLKKK
jgi:hypothetical protein